MTKRKVSKIVAGSEFFDPVLPVIDAHRKRFEIVLKAVRAEDAFHGNMKSAAYARLGKITKEAWHDLVPPARALVTTQPTTMLGAVALLQYLMMQFDEYRDCVSIRDTIDGEPWPFLAFRTLATGLVQMQHETAE